MVISLVEAVRTRIFSPEEERVLKTFIEKDEKLPRLYDLIYRIRKHGERLRNHVELMDTALRKFEGG